MTPTDIRAATQEQRQEQLASVLNDISSSPPHKRGERIDECVLLLLATLKYAKDNAPPVLKDRPLEYLKAMVNQKAQPGNFWELLQPRANQLVEWVAEYEDPKTPMGKRSHIRTLLQQAGLV